MRIIRAWPCGRRRPGPADARFHRPLQHRRVAGHELRRRRRGAFPFRKRRRPGAPGHRRRQRPWSSSPTAKSSWPSFNWNNRPSPSKPPWCGTTRTAALIRPSATAAWFLDQAALTSPASCCKGTAASWRRERSTRLRAGRTSWRHGSTATAVWTQPSATGASSRLPSATSAYPTPRTWPSRRTATSRRQALLI